MQRMNLSGMIVGLMLLCGGVLFASEADELRERARAMRKQASVMAERGNKEEAERLEREAGEMLEAAERMALKAKGRAEKGDRPAIEKEVHHLKERLQDLLAREKRLREANEPEQVLAEVRERIAGTERELHAIHARHAGKRTLPPEFHPQAEQFEAAARRIHHLRVAAQNLKLAEAHDLAHQLMEKAEAMEREVQEGKKRLAADLQQSRAGERGPDVVRELKEEIQRLRAEVKELRQTVERR